MTEHPEPPWDNPGYPPNLTADQQELNPNAKDWASPAV